MTHAYSELYLSDAQSLLANAFDYAINVCNLPIELFSWIFATSKYTKEYERGNPAIISGKSGIEFAQIIIFEAIPHEKFPSPKFTQDRTPEYWAGWALAYYHWYTQKRFKNIFERIPLIEIISMYNTFHVMDITHFIEAMDTKYDERAKETKLKCIRDNAELSQSELAALSGVTLRSIQLYEQRVNDIDKAQVQTLYKLSRALKCDIEDLLENPEK